MDLIYGIACLVLIWFGVDALWDKVEHRVGRTAMNGYVAFVMGAFALADFLTGRWLLGIACAVMALVFLRAWVKATA